MGTTAEKLSYLNGTKRLLRRRLNSLGANITLETKFRNYLVWLDRFYNAASSSVDFEILGETKQYAAYTSVNILPLYDDEIVTDGITVTVSDGGKITINGTATRDVWIKITNGMEAVYTEPVLVENNKYVDVYGWLNETVLDFGEGTNIITSNYHGGGDTPINANNDADIYQYITHENGTIVETSTGYNDFVNREHYFSDKDRISAGDINNVRRINCLYLFFNQGITVNQYFYKAISYESLNPWVANNDALSASPDNPKDFRIIDDITYKASDGTEFPIYLAYPDSPYNFILRGIGDYKDRLYYKNGKFYCERKIGSVTLNGSEFWGYGGINNVFYTTAITDYRTSDNIPISNYYKGVSNVSGAGGIEDKPNYSIGFINTRNNLRFYIKDTRFTTTNELIAWLNTHPTVVYYVLDEPVITEIENTTNNKTIYNQLKAIIDHETKLEIEKKIF